MEEMKFYELVYADFKVEELCRQQFPGCKITDASDGIHTERFEFEADIEDDEFYPFALKNGFSGCCLAFQIMMRTPGEEGIEKVKHWMDIVDPTWRDKKEA